MLTTLSLQFTILSGTDVEQDTTRALRLLEHGYVVAE